MSSLRAFRFQKTKPSTPSSSQEPSNGAADGHSQSTDDESPVIHTQPKAKRQRLISDCGSGSGSGTPVKMSNGYGFGGMPSPDVVQSRLDFMQLTFPNKDRMDLQDALKSSGWNVENATSKIRGDIQSIQQPAQQSIKASLPKKKAVKAHETFEMSESSESDDEGEYKDVRVVYDSDDDDSDNERRGPGSSSSSWSDDQNRVLGFFNEGLPQELACIQGCSKKKVESVLELRPYSSWTDLVRKCRASRQLNAELLNGAVSLLRMRDGVARLMDKCEKITGRMENLVERLTKGGRLELTEQPGSIPDGLELTPYQLIGVNWLALMHKQSLNGILADEMGLGKTIQAIAFLAHLRESASASAGPHLVIVPSSTLDNWQKEFATWCPSMRLLNYYGSQDERRHMRLQIVYEKVEYDILLTTYNMVVSSPDDRVLFRKINFNYVVFDEAHMLKNMATTRYENLMRVRSSRKLLLTGTPLQNNLVELMSLLVFVMPEMFANKKEQLTKMFSMFPKSDDEAVERSTYVKDRIAHAKRIMKPFFLRRLKSEVLTSLPPKDSSVETVPMSTTQHDLYFERVARYQGAAAAGKEGKLNETGVGMLMNLRKIANHPLLVRRHFDDGQLRAIARLLKRRDPGHREASESYIAEDLSVMSDFDIHRTCLAYRCIEHYSLGNHLICDSGKLNVMDDLLPTMKEAGDRVLLFSQFTMVLDILEQYLRIRGHKYLRLDGSTPVQERQLLIDRYNNDATVFVFILSTRAGGLGINLTSANVVILHDLDFNPYNDKQAEDRCHRVGQKRLVKVMRLLSADTIEQGIYNIAQEKLQLEQELTSSDGGEVDKRTAKKDVKRLLRIALDVDLEDEKQIGDVGKVYTEL